MNVLKITNLILFICHVSGQLLDFILGSFGEGNLECTNEVFNGHLSIGIFVHQKIEILLDKLLNKEIYKTNNYNIAIHLLISKTCEFCEIVEVSCLYSLSRLSVSHAFL